jgi:lipopolysaccharide transport system ATP-binding protein
MKRADIERRFDEIVAFAEVERFLDTPVKHYSSGMYVRLAFAVAAYLEPDILLVDEVLAVGDAAFQRKCVRKMGEVGTEGRTVVIVSHNMQLVRSLCDRCVVLDSGNVVADGGVSESVGTYFDRIGAFDRSMAQARTGVANKALIEAVRAVHTEHHDHRELELGFKIVCLEDVESVSLGFSIHDEEGRTMVVSYSGPRTLFSLSAGAHLIRARVWDLPITPGLYTVRARMESSGSELDWPKGDLGQFEVPSLDREQCTRSEVVKNGQLLLSPEWNIESLEGEDER